MASAWSDPAYADWLQRDATAAIASLGFSGRQGEHMQAVFNTEDTHNLVVCTLCSCYPWSVLGLPPVWYKAPPYRSRAVIDPRGVLAEFGLTLPADTKIRVWDSTAELRYLVVPQRPAGSEGLDEDGTCRPGHPRFDDRHRPGEAAPVNGPQDLGGQMGFGPVAPEKDEPVFHAGWEKRALGVTIAAGAMGHWNIDESRHARESLHPADYYASSYYEIWIKGLEVLLQRHGFVTADELAKGAALAAGAAPKRVLKGSDVAAALAKGGPCNRPVATPARFACGRPGAHARTSTRPAIRGCRAMRAAGGIVDAVREGFVFPDSNAHGKRREPAMGLHGRLRRGRDLGRGRRSDADGVDRRLGELS